MAPEGVSWQRDALRAPLFRSIGPLLDALPTEDFPTLAQLNALAVAADVRNTRGTPLRFVAAERRKLSAREYESGVYERAELVTREANWHDFFNTLAWLSFPRTKAALNRMHVACMADEGGQRSRLRDLLTLFDESGLFIACADESLAALLREHRWRELFVERRGDVLRSMSFDILGHALHEKGLTPFKGMTAKALMVNVDTHFFALSRAEQLRRLDEAGEAFLVDREKAGGAALQPLPILGIPGWSPQNAAPAYYDDTGHFRPRRAA